MFIPCLRGAESDSRLGREAAHGSPLIHCHSSAKCSTAMSATNVRLFALKVPLFREAILSLNFCFLIFCAC